MRVYPSAVYRCHLRVAAAPVDGFVVRVGRADLRGEEIVVVPLDAYLERIQRNGIYIDPLADCYRAATSPAAAVSCSGVNRSRARTAAVDIPAGGVNNGNTGIAAAPGYIGAGGIRRTYFCMDVIIPRSGFYGYPAGIDVYRIDTYHNFFPPIIQDFIFLFKYPN